jgi:hypothetical protein
LYFSCKNYQELAQARITKVVGYCTTNPKKLVLYFSDFSTIFYAIYKNKGNHFIIGVTLLQGSPQKESWFSNVVPRGAAGAAPVQFRLGGRRSSPREGGEEV